MDDRFLTLAAPGQLETRVLASRFLAFARPVEDEEEARAFLQERERLDFDATHHCAAWRLRDDRWRALDAGEPSGSAGAPILAAIEGAGLVDTAIVVTRYFGGTKLGVGGLARAYGEAAAGALAGAPKRLGLRAQRLRITYPYERTALIMRAVERLAAHELEHGYSEGGAAAVLDFTLPLSTIPELERFLSEQSAGALDVERLQPVILYLPHQP